MIRASGIGHLTPFLPGLEGVLGDLGVPIRHLAGDRAFYSLEKDEITLPERGQFPSANHFCQTALHELGHSTGHPDRMNRACLLVGMSEGFGSPAYAKESSGPRSAR